MIDDIQHVHTRSTYDRSARVARRHPNGYWHDVRETHEHAAEAARHLEHWRLESGAGRIDPSVMPTEALHDVVLAYEHLSDLVHTLPKVTGFVCGYDWSVGGPSHTSRSRFSAHVTRVEAERWLAAWQRSVPAGDSGWMIFENEPADVILFREEGPTDEEIAHAVGRR